MKKIITIICLIAMIVANGTINYAAKDLKDSKKGHISNDVIIPNVKTTKISNVYENNNIVVEENNINWVYDASTQDYKLKDKTKNDLIKNCFVNYKFNNGNIDLYYVDKTGEMIRGWLQTGDESWYYFEVDKMKKPKSKINGWNNINGKQYYFTSDSKLLTNSVTPDNFLVDYKGEKKYSEAIEIQR